LIKNPLNIKIVQPELKTNRLLLRNMLVEDYKDLFETRFHPEVLKHIKRDQIEDKLEMKTFISERLEAIKNNSLCFWAISTFESPKLIGTICLWNYNENKTTAEIGYDLHPDYHKKGFMSEAMEVVLKFGFSKLQLHSIEAFTSKQNDNSKRLLEKFDFNLEAHRKDKGFPNNIIYTKQHA
jgi:ribosomal-protein-alanine N-acetyltransferase